jgi:hypothetical protein
MPARSVGYLGCSGDEESYEVACGGEGDSGFSYLKSTIGTGVLRNQPRPLPWLCGNGSLPAGSLALSGHRPVNR